jgi:hypothetical protein
VPESAWQLPKTEAEGSKMNSHYLRNKVGRILLTLAFMAGIGIVSSTAVQAQWQWPNQDPYRRDRDRDIRRDDRYGRNGGYGNISQIAFNQGYQDGVYTGSRDGERRQNYDPQRSHFYRNGHGNNSGYGRIDNSYQFQQAYRSGFLRGYQEGYQRYGGYNRGNSRNNGRYGRWPF